MRRRLKQVELVGRSVSSWESVQAIVKGGVKDLNPRRGAREQLVANLNTAARSSSFIS